MSCCNSCGSPRCATPNNCYEARLALGLDSQNRRIIGSIDGVHITPVDLKPAVSALESNTSLKWDPNLRAIVYRNEKSVSGNGSPDQISARDILSGTNLSEIGGVLPLVQGGMVWGVIQDDRMQLLSEVPLPVEAGETTGGLVTYVPDPNNDTSFYRLIRPDITGTVDTILVGHPDGGMEFVAPIASPVMMEVSQLTSDGRFNGSPSTSSGTWRYQQMGQTSIITNNSGSSVKVTLELRWSMQTTGTRSGFYASLVNGGSDYQTEFVSGLTNEKQEGYPGGQGRWTAVLLPNQRCQFRFGGWTNASGNMDITVGSISESAGSAVYQVQVPAIYIERLI